MNIQLSDILQLSIPERLQWVEAIWDSIAAQPESLPITESEKAYIDSRLADLRDNPDDDFSWEEVRDNLLKRERIQLVGDIWDSSIANEPKSFSLTDAQRAELDRRMEAYKQNPQAGLTLEELEQKFSQ